MFQQKLKMVLFLLCLSVLVGCSGKIKRMRSFRKTDNFELQESVARLTMIPEAPLGFMVERVTQDAKEPSSSQIQYRLTKKRVVDLELLQSSYLADMELLGWNCVSQFCGTDEMILLFERPGGFLSQVSYNHNSGLRVTILSKKKGL